MSEPRIEGFQPQIDKAIQCVKGRNPSGKCFEQHIKGQLVPNSADVEKRATEIAVEKANKRVEELVASKRVEIKRDLAQAQASYLKEPNSTNKEAYEELDAKVRLYESEEFAHDIHDKHYQTYLDEEMPVAREEAQKSERERLEGFIRSIQRVKSL